MKNSAPLATLLILTACFAALPPQMANGQLLRRLLSRRCTPVAQAMYQCPATTVVNRRTICGQCALEWDNASEHWVFTEFCQTPQDCVCLLSVVNGEVVTGPPPAPPLPKEAIAEACIEHGEAIGMLNQPFIFLITFSEFTFVDENGRAKTEPARHLLLDLRGNQDIRQDSDIKAKEPIRIEFRASHPRNGLTRWILELDSFYQNDHLSRSESNYDPQQPTLPRDSVTVESFWDTNGNGRKQSVTAIVQKQNKNSERAIIKAGGISLKLTRYFQN